VTAESKPNEWRYMDSAGCEACRTVMTIKTKYNKDQINELAICSKTKHITDLYRGIK
jgi:hypothetical protein